MRTVRDFLGLEGPVLGIGTAALCVPYGPPGAKRSAPEPEQARRVLHAAVERGLRFVDTAPAYGESETIVGNSLGDRQGCLLATKLITPAGGWDALSPRETRDHVRASTEASLVALRRERLDLLQVHNANESLVRRGAVAEALAGLRDEGLVARAGATVYGEADALAVIACPAFDVVQIAFSALDRRPEHRILAAAAAANTAVVARSLLLHGVLSSAARDLDGPFTALGAAADAVREALGASWQELPGAAVAFAASCAEIGCALLGPRDESELTMLLDQAEHFSGRMIDLELPILELPEWMLDPSRWPAEATVVG